MAPVHQISAILHVADIASQLSFSLSAYSRNSYVPLQVADLAKTIACFALVLQRSATLCKSHRSICSERAAENAQQIAKKGTRALDEIDDMLEMAREVPESDIESASANREYVEACFETARVNFLLAHIKCLEFNTTLILQIVELGKKINLLAATENEQQQQEINEEMTQEELIAYDVLFARQLQIAEVERTWATYESAHPDMTRIEKRRMGLPKIGPIEDELETIFTSDEAMTSVSEHAIMFLLAEWTTLDLDRKNEPEKSHIEREDADVEDAAYYAPEEEYNDRYGSEYQGGRTYSDRPRPHHSHSRDSQIYDGRDGYRDTDRNEQHHRRRPSYQSDSDRSSYHERRPSNSHRRRYSNRPTSDSEDDREHSRHNRRDSRRQDDDKKDSNKAEKKKNSKNNSKEDDKKDNKQGKDDESADGDQKPDDPKNEGLGSLPLEALVLGGVIDMAKSALSKRSEKAEAASEAPSTEAPIAQAVPEQRPSKLTASPQLGSAHIASTPNLQLGSHVNTATSPNTSPHLGGARLAQEAGGQSHHASHSPGRQPSQAQQQPSSAAQRYTPQGVSPQASPQKPSVGYGHAPASYTHSSPVAQYATQYEDSHRRSSSQLRAPPQDRYGPHRSEPSHSSSHDRLPTERDDYHTVNRRPSTSSRPLYHDERIPSPNRPQQPQSAPSHHASRPYDDRTPPPRSAPYYSSDRPYDDRSRPFQQTSNPQSAQSYGERPYRSGYLSPDDPRGRRYSASHEESDYRSSHNVDSRRQRPSGSPSRRYDEDRPPPRDYGSRRSPPRGRRPESLERRSSRVDRPRSSSRRGSRPTSRNDSSRVRPSSKVKPSYRPKPVPVRTKIKPSNARAASKFMGSLKLSPNLVRGLGMLGKIRR